MRDILSTDWLHYTGVMITIRVRGLIAGICVKNFNPRDFSSGPQEGYINSEWQKTLLYEYAGANGQIKVFIMRGDF